MGHRTAKKYEVAQQSFNTNSTQIPQILGFLPAQGEAPAEPQLVAGLWDSWDSATGWVGVHAADVSGEGRLDLVGRDQASGQWWAGLSDGSSFLQRPVLCG